MKTKVSVIVPVHNGERYIVQALDSVFAQTYSELEVIAVDDASTDNTKLRLQPYLDRLTYLYHPTRRGVCAALITGIKNATGDLIAFLDSDDIWLPAKLEVQVAYLAQHPDISLVHSDYQTFDDQGIIEASVAQCRNITIPSGDIFKDLFMRNLICGNTVLVKAICFDQVGTFDEALITGDSEMWLRIARRFKIGYIRQVLSKYRQHEFQLSRNLDAMVSCAKIMIDKLISLYPELVEELGPAMIRRRLAGIYFGAAYYCLEHADFPNFRNYLVAALRLRPAHYVWYFYYLASYLDPSHVSTLRRAYRRFSESLACATRTIHR